MFVDVAVVRVMQMAVVEIVDVAGMLDGDVTAAGTMLMIVVGVLRALAFCHFAVPWMRRFRVSARETPAASSRA